MLRLVACGAVLALVAGCAGGPMAPAPMVIPEQPDLASLKAGLEGGTLTSERLVRTLLERIEDRAALNAFITVNPAALELARERDRQRLAGQVLGPLHGIPLVVKDNIHVAGLPNTAGTPALRQFTPRDSNGTVARLQQAGAIILGKTNLHELAFGITSDNGAFGAVGNPVNPQLMAGGSSGGTAAAIAAGLAPAGLGSDTGGSVRIPAALTGISGFRPSPGRYPSEAVTPISKTRDTVGTMAWNVADLQLLDQVLAGSAPAPMPESIRLGIVRDYYFAGLEQSMARATEELLDRLRRAGVTIVEIDYPALQQQVSAGFPLTLFEARRDLIRYLADFETGISLDRLAAEIASPDVKGIFGAVTNPSTVSEADYRAALAQLAAMRAGFDELFAEHQIDALVFPTTPLTARPLAGSIETVDLDGQQVPTFPTYIRNTEPASLAGLPAISIGAGVADNGLPFGLELDGPAHGDAALLALARRVEALIQQE